MTSEHKINKSEFYSEHVQSWQRSGMSQEKYCKSVNISYPAFVYWRSKFLAKDKEILPKEEQKFVPLIIPSSIEKVKSQVLPLGDEKITVTLPSGIQLYFPLSVNPTCLGEYIKAIKVCQ